MRTARIATRTSAVTPRMAASNPKTIARVSEMTGCVVRDRTCPTTRSMVSATWAAQSPWWTGADCAMSRSLVTLLTLEGCFEAPREVLRSGPRSAPHWRLAQLRARLIVERQDETRLAVARPHDIHLDGPTGQKSVAERFGALAQADAHEAGGRGRAHFERGEICGGRGQLFDRGEGAKD